MLATPQALRAPVLRFPSLLIASKFSYFFSR